VWLWLREHGLKLPLPKSGFATFTEPIRWVEPRTLLRTRLPDAGRLARGLRGYRTGFDDAEFNRRAAARGRLDMPLLAIGRAPAPVPGWDTARGVLATLTVGACAGSYPA
jgi:hypothetical protein